jgi:uncharacterized protein YcaQ
VKAETISRREARWLAIEAQGLAASRPTLRVQAAYTEPGVDVLAAAGAARDELDRLRSWLGLDTTSIGDRGDLADLLR